MKIIIAGGREFQNYGALCCVMDGILADIAAPVTIVSGAARGADALGEQYAAERGLEVMRFPADWKKFGRRAGPIRNEQMAEAASMLVAFWDGQSRGTKNMIANMGQRAKPYRVFDYAGQLTDSYGSYAPSRVVLR